MSTTISTLRVQQALVIGLGVAIKEAARLTGARTRKADLTELEDLIFANGARWEAYTEKAAALAAATALTAPVVEEAPAPAGPYIATINDVAQAYAGIVPALEAIAAAGALILSEDIDYAIENLPLGKSIEYATGARSKAHLHDARLVGGVGQPAPALLSARTPEQRRAVRQAQAYNFAQADRKRLSAYLNPATGQLEVVHGRHGRMGAAWPIYGRSTFASVYELELALEADHAAGKWAQTAVRVAPGEWEIMTDGVRAWWEEGSHGAAEAKAALALEPGPTLPGDYHAHGMSCCVAAYVLYTDEELTEEEAWAQVREWEAAGKFPEYTAALRAHLGTESEQAPWQWQGMQDPD